MRDVSIVLVLALVACGGDDQNGHLADAPLPIDAAGDASAQGGPVTLTVTSNGRPVPGVHVYFLNADSSMVKTADTDAAGTASAIMVAGGSVTAIDPFPTPVIAAAVAVGDNELNSFLGVKPGDHLVLTHTDTQTVAFTLRASAVTGASDYQVFTTCGSGAITPGGGGGSGSPDPGGVVSLDNCHGAADIAIVARDVSTSTPLSALYHPDATLPDEGTLDLTADTYQALTDVTFTYMNASAPVTVQHSPVLPHGLLGPFSLDAFEGSGTIHEPTLAGATEGIVDTSLSLIGEHEIVDWGPLSASYMLDLASVLLPDILDQPSYDIATRRVSWTEAAPGTGALPDLSFDVLEVTRPEPSSRRWEWVIVAPYTRGEIVLPRLPTDIADWTPAAGDTVHAEEVTNAKVPGGYDAVRARALDSVSLSDLLPGTGRAIFVRSNH
jgi:hypothetical protein